MLTAGAGQFLIGPSLRRLVGQLRSLHIPRRLPPPSNPTNLVHQTWTLISRSIAHVHGPSPAPSVRSFPSIRQSLSLPTRIALSRPLRAPCLPRAPRVPGNVTHVGLGSARNFSSGRPIFQHLVQNVPVTGRAFYEVDCDLKTRREKNSKVRKAKKTRRTKLADKLGAKYENIAPTAGSAKEVEHEQLDHYFPTLLVPRTTTYLQIPLAPTPSGRVPLSSTAPPPHLLPLSALAKEHASHSKHSIRVSSLFRRLDAARVWERGASCETFGDPSGLCTILRVKFDGWTRPMVKDVLGDAGRDWCTIQEFQHTPEEYCTSKDSMASSSPRVLSPEPIPAMAADAAGISFVMPTLDFSSSFVSVHSAPTSWPGSPASHMSHSDVESDYSFPSAPPSALDGDTDSEVFFVESPSPMHQASSAGGSAWLNFSSEFATRVSQYQQISAPS